jgi:hypothetical protein
MDIEGAKILRDRLEQAHGTVPDAEPTKEVPTKEVEHRLPLYRWFGITPAEQDDDGSLAA